MERQSFKKLFPKVSGTHNVFQNLSHCIPLQAFPPIPPLSHVWLSALSAQSVVLWETDLTSGFPGRWWPAQPGLPFPSGCQASDFKCKELMLPSSCCLFSVVQAPFSTDTRHLTPVYYFWRPTNCTGHCSAEASRRKCK